MGRIVCGTQRFEGLFIHPYERYIHVPCSIASGRTLHCTGLLVELHTVRCRLHDVQQVLESGDQSTDRAKGATWVHTTFNGWLLDSCGFWLYLPCSSERMELSSCT